MPKIFNIEGKIFGKLKVINFAYIKNHKAYWNCICECGKNKVIAGTCLVQGQTKTCGCGIGIKYDKHPSIETKIKIGLGNKGKIVSEEVKKKISAKMKGKPSWCKGKKLSKKIIENRKYIVRKVKCNHCNNEFETNSNKRAYCSERCRRETYKNKAKENYNQYILRNPGKKGLSSKISRLKNKFNLTIEEYNQLIQLQNNKCKICSAILNIDINRDNWNEKACIDHNHQTGKIRGILCSNCNHGIGFFKDNIDLLIKAQKYLEEAL
jgi:hypothetical protein